MSEYVANGNMYDAVRCYSNPFGSMGTKPFKTSINELYNYMLQRCLRRTKEYDDANTSIEFSVLRHMQKEMHEYNPLSVILSDDAYYFPDSEIIRRIDKYESN